MFNPSQLKKLMKQMNVKQVNALRVEIFLDGGNKLVINDPEVTKMEIMGEEVFQVKGGNVKEEVSIPLEDVKLVSLQAGVSDEEALKKLKELNGDIARAIKELKEANQ